MMTESEGVLTTFPRPSIADTDKLLGKVSPTLTGGFLVGLPADLVNASLLCREVLAHFRSRTDVADFSTSITRPNRKSDTSVGHFAPPSELTAPNCSLYLPRPQSLSLGGEENEKKFFVGHISISHHALPGNDITATDLYSLKLHCTVPNEGPAEEAALYCGTVLDNLVPRACDPREGT